MNMPIAWLTLRQLLGAKRTLLLVAAALLPITLAIVFRLTDPDVEPARFIAQTLLGRLVEGTMLPLAALVVGTAALGSEIEDGTAVYLLSKPLPRRVILLPKLAVCAGLTLAMMLVVTVIAGAIAAGGEEDGAAVILGFAVAVAAGSVVYSALFVLLSVYTTRAFISGLLYVFLWEQVVTRIFTGTRILSVRQYTIAVADGVAHVSSSVFDGNLDTWKAVVMMVVVTIAATYFAIRRLERFEIGETA